MIKGIMLGVGISATVTSFLLVVLGNLSQIKVNYLTGAVVGVNQIIDYSVTIFFISLIFTLTIIALMKKKHQ